MRAGDFEAWDAWVDEKWPDQNFATWDDYLKWLLGALKEGKH